MVHPYIINLINSVVLITAGLAAYFLIPAQPTIVLIAPAFGVLLIAFTNSLKKHNWFVFNSVTALTLLFGALAIMRLYYGAPDIRYNSAFTLIAAISCFVAVLFYIGSFSRERRLRNNSIYKEDI
ncbi:hypothetical protein [Pontibacter silvestris]|uniref:hypothetical protein n=1 Tax=Pontibacter silvestris TaxID=2305183 RepID=UPI00366ECE00